MIDSKEEYLKNTRFFVLTVLSLCFIGLGMIYSASYLYAKEEFGSSLHFFIKQLVFMIAAFGVAYVLSRSKFSFWYKSATYINILVSLVLILSFIPGVGISLKGSSRWISIGFISLQPGELAKYSILLASIPFFQNFESWDVKERIKNLIFLLFPMLLIIFQPDYGMFVMCFVNLMLVCFLSRFPRKWFVQICLSGVALMGAILVLAPYRVQRLMTFLDPWNDPQNTGFQIIQSFLAFARGQFLGQGLGASKGKLFYLPEAHNDFIFSVLGEELGFVGVIVVVALFISFLFFGFRVALRINKPEYRIFGIAAIFTISFQAFLNMAVVIGILPTKGLNLPFISYGGSSLLANLMVIGLFLSNVFRNDENTNSKI